MSCSFPDLNWARLRVYEDDSADVFDSDGSTFNFYNKEEAQSFLSEDEYVPFDELEQDDEEELGVSVSSIKPPLGNTDEELLPQMLHKSCYR
jgi:hypothetical protein